MCPGKWTARVDYSAAALKLDAVVKVPRGAKTSSVLLRQKCRCEFQRAQAILCKLSLPYSFSGHSTQHLSFLAPTQSVWGFFLSELFVTYAKGFYKSNTWTALNILLIDRSARFLSGL